MAKRKRKKKGINPGLGALGLLGLTLGPELWRNRGAIGNWAKGLFNKDNDGDLSQMPFGSDERIAEYQNRNWAPDDTLYAPTTSAGDLSQMPFGSQERIDEYNNRGWAMDETTMVPGGVSEEVGERYPVSDEIAPIDYSGSSYEVENVDPKTNLPANSPNTSGNDITVPDWDNPASITQGDVDTYAANQALQGNDMSGMSILAGGHTPDAGGIDIIGPLKGDTVPKTLSNRWIADKLGFDIYNSPHGAAPSSDLSNTMIQAPNQFNMAEFSKLGTNAVPGQMTEEDFFGDDPSLYAAEPLTGDPTLLGGGETTWPGQASGKQFSFLERLLGAHNQKSQAVNEAGKHVGSFMSSGFGTRY
jgi:hypothetical protein